MRVSDFGIQVSETLQAAEKVAARLDVAHVPRMRDRPLLISKELSAAGPSESRAARAAEPGDGVSGDVGASSPLQRLKQPVEDELPLDESLMVMTFFLPLCFLIHSGFVRESSSDPLAPSGLEGC